MKTNIKNILICVFSLFLLSLSGYLIYSKLIDRNKQKTKENSHDSDVKEDESKESEKGGSKPEKSEEPKRDFFVYVPDTIAGDQYKILRDLICILLKAQGLRTKYKGLVDDLKNSAEVQNQTETNTEEEKIIEETTTIKNPDISNDVFSLQIKTFDEIYCDLTNKIFESIKNMINRFYAIKKTRLGDVTINFSNNFIYFYEDIFSYLKILRKAQMAGSEIVKSKLEELYDILDKQKFFNIRLIEKHNEVDFNILDESFFIYKKQLYLDMDTVLYIEEDILGGEVIYNDVLDCIEIFEYKYYDNLDESEPVIVYWNVVQQKINAIIDQKLKEKIEIAVQNIKESNTQNIKDTTSVIEEEIRE